MLMDLPFYSVSLENGRPDVHVCLSLILLLYIVMLLICPSFMPLSCLYTHTDFKDGYIEATRGLVGWLVSLC